MNPDPKHWQVGSNVPRMGNFLAVHSAGMLCARLCENCVQRPVSTLHSTTRWFVYTSTAVFASGLNTEKIFLLKVLIGRIFLAYYIQHCFICRPSESTVPTDAGIEPRSVANDALAVGRFNHQARSHPRKKNIHGTRYRIKKDRCLITFFLVAEGRYTRGPRTLGTSDFDAQTSGIKLWKGDESLRPVYKNRFACIECTH